MENIRKITPELDVITYTFIVDSIVDGFFGEDGDYTPHMGYLNMVRLFYNQCVNEDIEDLSHDITDALKLEPLFKCEWFLEEYEKHIADEKPGLTFARAYRNALDIIEVRKTSFNQGVTVVKNAVIKLIDFARELFSDENMAKIDNLIDKFAGGDVNEESVLNFLGDTEALRKVVEFAQEKKIESK